MLINLLARMTIGEWFAFAIEEVVARKLLEETVSFLEDFIFTSAKVQAILEILIEVRISFVLLDQISMQSSITIVQVVKQA